MAWLHTAPKRHNKDDEPKSRINTLDEDDPARCLPEIDSYIDKCFQLMGLQSNSSMGSSPLSWADVAAFCSQSAYELNGWESEQIVLMSRAYVYFSHEAKDISCPSPYNMAVNDEDAREVSRSIVNDKFLSMLNAME